MGAEYRMLTCLTIIFCLEKSFTNLTDIDNLTLDVPSPLAELDFTVPSLYEIHPCQSRYHKGSLGEN